MCHNVRALEIRGVPLKRVIPNDVRRDEEGIFAETSRNRSANFQPRVYATTSLCESLSSGRFSLNAGDERFASGIAVQSSRSALRDTTRENSYRPFGFSRQTVSSRFLR